MKVGCNKNRHLVNCGIVLVTVYVKKEEEKAYHAVMLDTLTAHDFKMEVCI